MNLIYFTIGYNPGYVKLLEVCLASLRKKCDMSTIKLLVMCDLNYLPYVNNLGFDYTIITPENNSPEQVSMRKVEIFHFDMINNFEKVIYLDSDIVITGDLNVIFDNITKDNILYTFNESDDFGEHNLIYFGRQDYTKHQILEFVRRNIKVFNCGQFGFLVTKIMQKHFSNVLDLIKENDREFFYEQSFMNYYFNSHYLTSPIFNSYTILPTRGDRLLPNTCIAHFANATIPFSSKFHAMERLFNDFK